MLLGILYLKVVASYIVLNLSPDTHGDAQERTQTRAEVTRFLSPLMSKIDARKDREFIEMKAHTWNGNVGKFRE